MPLGTVNTTTSLANLALAALGENKRILDIEADTTSVGRAIQDAFWAAWDETLRGYPWDCAKKRVSLAAMSAAPAFGYTAMYQLPSDYIAPQELPDLGEGETYSVERYLPAGGTPGAEVLVLSCDLPAPLQLVYTYRLRNIAHADPAFIGAFKYLLAFEVGPSVTKDTKKRDAMWAAWQAKMSNATRADARQGPRRPMPDSAIVSERE
jgi:hypothetical protein